MDTASEDLRALVAHHHVREVICRVARGEDRRDAALVSVSFWPDATIDFGTEHSDLVLGGRYLDRPESRDGRWRIARRVMLYDWSTDLGVAADRSQGLTGAPFHADHFTGSAHGDYSETFFGR